MVAEESSLTIPSQLVTASIFHLKAGRLTENPSANENFDLQLRFSRAPDS